MMEDERSVFWKVTVSVERRKKVHMDMSCTKKHNKTAYLPRLTTPTCCIPPIDFI